MSVKLDRSQYYKKHAIRVLGAESLSLFNQ